MIDRIVAPVMRHARIRTEQQFDDNQNEKDGPGKPNVIRASSINFLRPLLPAHEPKARQPGVLDQNPASARSDPFTTSRPDRSPAGPRSCPGEVATRSPKSPLGIHYLAETPGAGWSEQRYPRPQVITLPTAPKPEKLPQ